MERHEQFKKIEPEKKAGSLKNKRILMIVFGILVLFLAGMIAFTKTIWEEYRQTIVTQQEKQMMLITQSVTDHMSNMIESSCDDLRIICEMYEMFEGEADNREDRDYMAQETARIATAEKDFVSNLNLLDSEGNLLNQVNPQTFVKQLFSTLYSDQIVMSVYEDTEGYTFLTFEKAISSGKKVELVVDLMKYYERLIASIRMGNNGYLLAKTSNGAIIMHPSKEQLGIDVIEGRKEMFQDIDLRDLENMIDKQKKGEEGISVYYSYWWTDKSLPRVKKIAAYTPLEFANDFFIISSVIDYNDIYVPVEKGVVRISVMLLIIFLSILAMIVALYFILKGNAKAKDEIAYLKELNAMLEEMHRSEDKIAHQQRLQIIGTMTSGIAHEFNNLLTPIMGYSAMLLVDMDKKNENYQDIKEIYDASEKAKEIIQQISALSGKNMETAFRYITAKSMLLRSLKMIRSICPENIELQEDICLDDQGFLGNETQMNQMMLNLCVNGFHAIGRENGVLKVQAGIAEAEEIRREHPDLMAEDLFQSFIKIKISDNGCGMPPEVQRQIFNPFFTTKKAGQGTGLGLTMVDNIIVSHRGMVTVNSEEGKGSEFTIYIPLSKESESELSEPEAIRQISGVSLLIFDNNPKVLRLIERGFKKVDIQVDTCSNTKEMLDVLKEKRYDFLMTDYNMSGTSGLSVAMAAKGIWPDIKIIVTTRFLRREIIQAKKEGVIDSYIEKPVACQQILKIMYEIERGEKNK